MMLMRDRSGRSGRRRGSQNPGTAIASAGGLTPGRASPAGGELSIGGAGACATAAGIAPTARAEELGVSDFGRLAVALAAV